MSRIARYNANQRRDHALAFVFRRGGVGADLSFPRKGEDGVEIEARLEFGGKGRHIDHVRRDVLAAKLHRQQEQFLQFAPGAQLFGLLACIDMAVVRPQLGGAPAPEPVEHGFLSCRGPGRAGIAPRMLLRTAWRQASPARRSILLRPIMNTSTIRGEP